MMTVTAMANNLGINGNKLEALIKQNEMPYKYVDGMMTLDNETMELALELYYQKYEGRNFGNNESRNGSFAEYRQYSRGMGSNYNAGIQDWNDDKIPEKYRPISAWGYLGYNLLFNIPIIGWVLLIIYATSDTNINTRNYARARFCLLLVILCVAVYIVLISN